MLTPDQQSAIVARLEAGGTITAWCRENGVDAGHVFRTLASDRRFESEASRARARGTSAMAEQIVEMVDALSCEQGIDAKMLTAKVAATRLRMDARLRVMQAWSPDVWGDRANTPVAPALTVQIAMPGAVPGSQVATIALQPGNHAVRVLGHENGPRTDGEQHGQ